MESLFVRLALVAAIAGCVAPLSAHETASSAARQVSLPPPARAAAATVDKFHAALRRGDTGSAAALLADDALIFESGGVERSRAEYVAHHLPADAEFSKMVSTAISRRAGGSNGILAWISSEGRTTGTYKGKAVDLATTETMILQRKRNMWKIVHIHWSSSAKR